MSSAPITVMTPRIVAIDMVFNVSLYHQGMAQQKFSFQDEISLVQSLTLHTQDAYYLKIAHLPAAYQRNR